MDTVLGVAASLDHNLLEKDPEDYERLCIELTQTLKKQDLTDPSLANVSPLHIGLDSD